MHDMGSDPIHEIAVVGDKQQGTGIAPQPILEPQTGIQIQVVSGLVQKQQIGRSHQGLGQVQADSPTTGKRRYRPVRVLVRESQPAQQGLGPAAGGPGLVHIQLTVYAGNGMIVTCGLGPGKFTFQAAQIQVAI